MFKTPSKTSKYKKEPEFKKNVVPFAPELISFIKEKKKLKTYRFGLKYDYLTVGDEIEIQNCDSKEIVARAKITEKRRIKFKEIPTRIEGHEVYRNKEHQRKVFSGYYTYVGRSIQDDDLFLVINFKLIED